MLYDNNILNCMCCDKALQTEPCDNPMVIHPVYDGLIFQSTGNFGSTVFDPMPIGEEEILQVVICDDCIKRKAKRVTWIHDVEREVTASAEPFSRRNT